MWNLSSRVHRLNHFPEPQCVCYAKRDDELGCGISGSKLRKYASLMPFLLEQKIQHVLIIAGPQSNNLLAALQLAREFKLKTTAFLIKPWRLTLQGNFKLSSLFLREEDIVWLEREEWSQVRHRAENYLHALSERAFILDEGSSVPQALSGAMTLATDILANERHLGLRFQHIFIDAGTGFSAAALIKGLAQLKHAAQIHVLLLADDVPTFQSKLNLWLGTAEEFKNYHCFYPTTAKAFGAVNQTIKNEVRRLAREEGILADPIYAAKLFYEARQHITSNQLEGNVLIIHSGGTLTMPSFDF